MQLGDALVIITFPFSALLSYSFKILILAFISKFSFLFIDSSLLSDLKKKRDENETELKKKIAAEKRVTSKARNENEFKEKRTTEKSKERSNKKAINESNFKKSMANEKAKARSKKHDELKLN